jgi:hypothetical protein
MGSKYTAKEQAAALIDKVRREREVEICYREIEVCRKRIEDLYRQIDKIEGVPSLEDRLISTEELLGTIIRAYQPDESFPKKPEDLVREHIERHSSNT